MEKIAASELLQDVLTLSAQLNIIASKIESLTSGEELKAMRKHMAQMMAACDENLFRPILRQYPELEPHP